MRVGGPPVQDVAHALVAAVVVRTNRLAGT